MTQPAPTTLAEIETTLGEAAAQEVRRAAHVLVQRQFLFAGDRGATHGYETLIRPRYRRYFETLFDSLGFRLILSDSEQWVGLLPDPDLELMPPRLRLDDTLVLLVLAHVWEEDVQRGGAEGRAVVVTTVNTLYDRYHDLAGRHRKEALTPARLLDILKGFGRRGLVRIGPFDPDADDHELDIRPMINRLMDGNALARLERFAPELDSEIAQARARHQGEGEGGEHEPDQEPDQEPEPNEDPAGDPPESAPRPTEDRS